MILHLLLLLLLLMILPSENVGSRYAVMAGIGPVNKFNCKFEAKEILPKFQEQSLSEPLCSALNHFAALPYTT